MSSFWDKLKPVAKAPTATRIDLEGDGRLLVLGWDDGKTTKISARVLRQICPCAECVDEWTRVRTFDPEKIPADMKVLSVNAVGNYALAFQFGDGHSTGIFQWETLREASEKNPG